MEKIVNLCKTRGYIYPGSDIYGGLANTWDYGPLGVELKNNVKKVLTLTFRFDILLVRTEKRDAKCSLKTK